jgi:hypothetical protein
MAAIIETSKALRATLMGAGESPRDWSDIEIQRLVGTSFMHPIVTEEARTVCQDAAVRVEHNRVRNVATGQHDEMIRVMPLDDSRYVAVVVPVLLDGRLLLVVRYRYAVDRWSLEFPRFDSQTRDTGWKHAAQSSLLKDVGLRATKMTLVGAIQPDAALVATSAVMIVAEGCAQRAARPANPRQLTAGTVAVTADELHRLVRRGEISCGVTLAALALYLLRAGH